MSQLRLFAALALCVSVPACAGSLSNPFGNLGNIFGGLTGQCNAGTQVQLASPKSGQYGVPTTIGQIMIVANGNSNNLYNTYSQWNLRLTDQYGNNVPSGNLNLVPGNGYQPYASDFYYSAQIPQLPGGSTWTVLLSQQGQSCFAVGTFST